MKIKEQTRKLAAGCSKQCFEVVDRTDEVSNHTYGTWLEFDFRRVLMTDKLVRKSFLPLFSLGLTLLLLAQKYLYKIITVVSFLQDRFAYQLF